MVSVSLEQKCKNSITLTLYLFSCVLNVKYHPKVHRFALGSKQVVLFGEVRGVIKDGGSLEGKS